ncbi:MAG: hypothetical protein WCR30_03670 [Clostridia bacterium]
MHKKSCQWQVFAFWCVKSNGSLTSTASALAIACPPDRTKVLGVTPKKISAELNSACFLGLRV